MSESAPSSGPEESGRRPTEAGPRRSRALVLGLILAVIVGIFVVMLLVTQCGSSADDVGQGDDPGPAVGIVVGAGSPFRA
jgi:hypothetical protein